MPLCARRGYDVQQLIDDIAEAVRAVDRCGTPFKQFRAGAGPYGEPQLVKLIAQHLEATHADRYSGIRTARVPDVLVPTQWALEFKIARPFGDNDKEAEHWSQNLLHPYAGNVSAISDALKLMDWNGGEKCGIIVVAYEHNPPRIDVSTLVSAFEMLCRELLKVPLGSRHVKVLEGCVHPVHQKATIFGWELVKSRGSTQADAGFPAPTP
ncbi:hypothetical protein BH09PLA1_BH09PLA1_29130 [soil metagenome]